MEKVRIGIVGCGCISDIYLTNLTRVFENVEVVGVCDLIRERAENACKEYGVTKIYDDVDALLADPAVEIMLNITQPPNHGWLNLKALEAGKNIYVEKPLALNREDGLKIKKLAEKKNLLAGGAPDTFLGSGIQTCRKLIEDGWIGRPVGATAFMMCHGHESWHPDPEFYYEAGGGPMFDMGPYYLTALVNLLGPVASVSGSAAVSFPTRTITSEKKYGKVVNVEVPTYVAGLLNFQNGAIGTIITSFDVWAAELPRIEIYGSEGTLSVPDPNTFEGPIRFRKAGSQEWAEIPLLYEYSQNSRGLGLADMAMALRTGRKHRANISLTCHVLDIMQGIHDASREGITYRLETSCEKPTVMPIGLLKGKIDE